MYERQIARPFVPTTPSQRLVVKTVPVVALGPLPTEASHVLQAAPVAAASTELRAADADTTDDVTSALPPQGYNTGAAISSTARQRGSANDRLSVANLTAELQVTTISKPSLARGEKIGVGPAASSLTASTAARSAGIEEESGDDEGAAAAVDGSDEGEDEEDDGALAMFEGLELDPVHRGWALGLLNLSIFGVGTLAASRLVVNVACLRCSMLVSVSLSGVRLKSEDSAAGSGSWQQWCPKCSLLHSASFRPTLVHEGSSALGYVDCTHCVPTGLVDASLIATCLECGTLTSVNHLSPPDTYEQACRMCYCRLRIDVRGSVLNDAASGSGVAPLGSSAALVGEKKVSRRFKIGQPLPENGTCSHYKHSYRWLRFPCCGQPFACDVCHDEASDHVHEWATRMICGRCSREQPFSQGLCVACGGRLTNNSGPKTRFWEGGDGERRQQLLHRNDSHKYKGLNKTQSRKSSRVGPKPKPEA
jgi:uncharacterized CHY-type Zn-finger protein